MSNNSGDSVHQVQSGQASTTRLSNRIAVILSRFNYVTYDALGSNLPPQGFFGFIGRILNGSGGQFRYVETQDDLLTLFKEDHLTDIPWRLRPLVSEATDRWIYIYCQPREVIWQIHYRGILDWDCDEFLRDGDGDFQPQRSESSGGRLYEISRRDLPDCFGIALPSQVDMKTADMIFTGGYRANSDFLRFAKLRLINRLSTQGPAEARLIVFDPGNLVDMTIDALSAYERLMTLVDIRLPSGRLSAEQRRIRLKGILACLCKQLAEADSALEDDFNMGQLDAEFTRYADYGARRCRLIDNLYNFLSRPVMLDLQKQFMVFSEGDQRPDGKVWLQIIAAMTSIAGDHELLSDYLVDQARAETSENAWAAFFKASLGRGGPQETAMANAWKTGFSQVDAAEMISSTFTVAAYELLFAYVGRPADFSGYVDELQALRDCVGRNVRALGAANVTEGAMAKIASVYRVANGLGELKAILEGRVDAGRIASVSDSLANAATLAGAKGLAMKALVVKNIFDIYASGSGAVDRIQMEDYNAAVGHAMVVGAGLAELGLIGYGVATGASVGGPVGAIIGLVSAAGAVIVILATDSDTEYFARRCMWGQTPGEGTASPGWIVGSCDDWRADDQGLKKQLHSLINCLHRFTVAHSFDPTPRVVEINIRTKFLPDTAKFVFRGEFKTAGGRTSRTLFTLRFPSHRRDRYQDFTVPTSGGRSIISANYRVQQDGEEFLITVNLKMAEGYTTGEGWLTCQPFGHQEFTVPHDGQAFHLQQLIEHSNILINRDRDYAFEPDEWDSMPGWTTRG